MSDMNDILAGLQAQNDAMLRMMCETEEEFLARKQRQEMEWEAVKGHFEHRIKLDDETEGIFYHA